ncbi:MAG: sigma-E processing peptidase SpoIIGA [Hungatella sp.]
MGQKSVTYNLYIDVVFFINLVMDVIALTISGKLLKLPILFLRIMLGGLIGAVWACILSIYRILPIPMEWFITYFGIGSLMVKVTFQTKGIRELMRGLLGLYLAAITLGGGMSLCYRYASVGMPFVIWVLLIAGTCFGIRYLFLNLLETRKQKSHLYSVILSVGEKQIRTVGFLDTGNHLYDPISHRPVHIASRSLFQQLYREDRLLLWIPYHTIGTQEGAMPGIVIDTMEIVGEESREVVQKPLIALSSHALCQDKSYEILLHEDH